MDVHPTAVIEKGSELGQDVHIGPYCVIGPDVTLKDGCTLKAHVVIDGWTTLGEGCTVFPFASIGSQTQDLKYRGARSFVEIGAGTTLREYVTVNSGTTEEERTRVGERCHLMAYAHVAHGCSVGDEVIMANCATLAGHVEVCRGAILGGLSGVHQFCRIGAMCMVGGCTKITRDCPPFMIVDGNPAAVRGVNVVGLRRRGFKEDVRSALKKAYRILYNADLSVTDAVARIRKELDGSEEIEELLKFIESSERGIIK